MPHGSARRAKGKGDFTGNGPAAQDKGAISKVDGKDEQGDWPWDQPSGKGGKREAVNIIDQDGYDLAKRSRRLGHFMQEDFAVDVNSTEGFCAKGPLRGSSQGSHCCRKGCSRRLVGSAFGFRLTQELSTQSARRILRKNSR